MMVQAHDGPLKRLGQSPRIVGGALFGVVVLVLLSTAASSDRSRAYVYDRLRWGYPASSSTTLPAKQMTTDDLRALVGPDPQFLVRDTGQASLPFTLVSESNQG